jgi:pimeloyl-ACP methyl ester carboxylesterase
MSPVLLFHGVGDDSALMRIYNAVALSHHFRLYAVDTIGRPGKSVPNKAYNKGFDDAVWIDEVMDGLRLSKANIAGVSHGAYLAQYYTLARPDRVGKVICMAGSVPVAGQGSPL